MNKKVTMSDIAQEMSVSIVTVSKALSDKEGVSDEVRQQIKDKAEEMGYHYSAGHGGKDGTLYNIGVIVAEHFFSDNAFYSNLYQQLVKELGKTNYSCILELLSAEDEKNDVMPMMISGNKIDGLIILGDLKKHYIRNLQKQDIPYIFLDFYNDQLVADTVVSDSVYGSYILTNYLAEQGHTEIGFVGTIDATNSILDRYLGYYKVLIQRGLAYHEEWIIPDRDASGLAIELVLPKKLPTAFVVNCDETAYHLVETLKAKGLRVPEDISVVGFDDYIYATLCNPQLTTFRVSQEMMAETAVDTLIRKIHDNTYHSGRKVISGDIVIRDSVKKIK